MKIDNSGLQFNNILGTKNTTQISDNMNSLDSTDSTGNSDSGISFFDTLKQKLDEVNNDQLNADATTEAFIKGDNVDVHQVMIASEEAKQSLELAVQVRNKLVEAFQEINRMQL